MSTAVPTPPSTAVPTPPSSRRAALRSRSVHDSPLVSARQVSTPRRDGPPACCGGVTDENATPRGMEASPLPSPLPRCAICLSPMRGRRRQPRVDAGDETLAAGADPEPSSPKLRELIVTECGHTFHRSCVVDLQRAQGQAGGKKSKRSCPLCRKQLAAADSLTPSDKILPTPDGRSASGASFSLRALATPRSFSQWRLRLASPSPARASPGLGMVVRPPAEVGETAAAPRLPAASAVASVDSEAVAAASRRGRAAVARSLAIASLAVQERFRFPTALPC